MKDDTDFSPQPSSVVICKMMKRDIQQKQFSSPCDSRKNGFSLIEVLIAMMILTVGILSLYTLYITSIKGNSKGNSITTASTWAVDQIEYLMALDYSHPDLVDGSHGPITKDLYIINWTVDDMFDNTPPLDGSKNITITVSSTLPGALNTSVTLSSIRGKSI